MPLDLEEQEQVADLKAWWQTYGTIVLGCALESGAFPGPRASSSRNAPLLPALLADGQTVDARGLESLVHVTPRASSSPLWRVPLCRGAQVSAATRAARLQRVIDGQAEDLREPARLRLGAVPPKTRPHQALAMADAPHAAATTRNTPRSRATLVAKNQRNEAKPPTSSR
jgi:hypothetical protein